MKWFKLKTILGFLCLFLYSVVLAQTHVPSIRSIDWSPDGKWIAFGIGLYSAESHDYSVRIVHAQTDEITSRLDFHSGEVLSVSWSPDSNHLITSGGRGSDGVSVVWDMNKEKLAAISQAYSMPGRLADIWSPDGTRVANVSEASPSVHIWDPTNGERLHDFESPQGDGRPTSIAWSPDGMKLLVGTGIGTSFIINSETGECLQSFSGDLATVRTVAWSPDANLVAVADKYLIHIWNSEDGTLVHHLIGHTDFINKIVWSPDGEKIATVSDDGTLRIWNVQSGDQIQMLTFAGPLYAVAWSPDGSKLAYGGFESADTLNIVSVDTIPLLTPSPVSTPS